MIRLYGAELPDAPSATDVLGDILKDSSYGLEFFSEAEIEGLKRRITSRPSRGSVQHYVTCLIRGKDIVLKPEEVVRQLYLGSVDIRAKFNLWFAVL